MLHHRLDVAKRERHVFSREQSGEIKVAKRENQVESRFVGARRPCKNEIQLLDAHKRKNDAPLVLQISMSSVMYGLRKR